MDENFGWKKYYNLDAIYAWLDQLLEKYPKVLTNYNYGKSYEGRTLRAIKVSHKEVGKKTKLQLKITQKPEKNFMNFQFIRKTIEYL